MSRVFVTVRFGVNIKEETLGDVIDVARKIIRDGASANKEYGRPDPQVLAVAGAGWNTETKESKYEQTSKPRKCRGPIITSDTIEKLTSQNSQS